MQKQTGTGIGLLDTAFAGLCFWLTTNPHRLAQLTVELGKKRDIQPTLERAIGDTLKVAVNYLEACVQEDERTRPESNDGDHFSDSILDISVEATVNTLEDDHIEASDLAHSGPASAQNEESLKGEEEHNECKAILKTSVVLSVVSNVAEKKEAPLRKLAKVKPSRLPKMNKQIVVAIISRKRKRSDSPVDDETLQKKPRYAEPTGIKTFVLPSQKVQEVPSVSQFDGEDDCIELPSICSQYSDDEDTDRHANEPSWSKGFALISHLRRQQRYNPDLFFGPIDSSPEAFEQMLPKVNREPRTSSINWTLDGLTLLEAAEYDEYMGYGRAARVA